MEVVQQPPGLPENGAQINKQDPANSPIESGNPATFARSSVGSDQTWSWTWDTTGTVLKSGTYEILASSTPNGFDWNAGSRGYFKINFKNPSADAVTTQSTTIATPTITTKPTTIRPTTTQSGNGETVLPGEVTIVTEGNQSYNLGDEINFTGTNTAAYKTYLFITGPGLAVNGSQIHRTDPKHSPIENGNPATFKQMDVQGDHSWYWKWGTSNIALDPGTYTIYAAARPSDKDNLEKTPYGTVSITLKKPIESATQAAPIMTPTKSPGYGSMTAMIGLGAVAFIIMRRR